MLINVLRKNLNNKYFVNKPRNLAKSVIVNSVIKRKFYYNIVSIKDIA